MDNRKKQEMREFRHKRIIEAAAALFAEKGYGDVSFEDIAVKADVARRTLYNHFRDKMSLFQGLCEPVLHYAVENLRAIVSRDNPQSKDLWEFCLGLWDKYGNRLKLINHITWDSLPELAALHDEFIQDFIKIFRHISHNKPMGLNPEDSALLVYRTFSAVAETLDGLEDRDLHFSGIMEGMIFRKS